MLDAIANFIERVIRAVAGYEEREAGHVLISLVLIGLGAALWKLHVPKGEDLIPFALGVLARSMIGRVAGGQA
jgi:hypothetical protein